MSSVFKKINEKFEKLLVKTKVKINLTKYFNQIHLSNDLNFIVSRGEFLTALIMSKFLKIPFVPAEKVIFLKNDVVDVKKTKLRIEKMLCKHKRFVTCGFYGVDNLTKNIVLFNRGGGDYSGAVISKLLSANLYENYTDVSGVKTANPQIIKGAKTITKLCYKDMALMSDYGAGVFQKEASLELLNSSVKTKINNIFNLNSSKTILNNSTPCNQFIGFKLYQDKSKILIIKNGKRVEFLTEEVSINKLLKELNKVIFKC